MTVATKSEPQQLFYDYLVVAVGSVTNYFGSTEIQEHAHGLKSLMDAIRLRNHMLKLFEDADWTGDPEELEALTTIVVVGGGPTGLETAGALYELYNNVLQREYHHLHETPVRVILVELQDNLLLAPYPERLQKAARRQLEEIGVEVMLETSVERVTEDTVHLSDGLVVRSKTLVWAAGVKASPFAESLGVELARRGRIPVKPTMELIERDRMYALGDVAYLED